jgi:Ca-activated chloride channel family protein
MKKYIILIIMIGSCSALFAQDAKTDIYNGNKLYDQKKFKEAEADYQKAAQKKKMPLESNFNMGDAMYKQKQFDGAAKNFTNIASATNDPQVKAGAYHNLGNSLLETKKYDESIEAYKKALLNNPKDDATRYNLAYAQEMLKKQKDQNQNNNQNNKNNQNNQNQQKNKNDKGDPDKKNQDPAKQDPNKQDPNKQDPNKQDQQKQQPQQPKDGIAKDDAQRMLDALNNQEQGTQDKLKNKKLKGAGTRVLKDW